MNNIIDTVEESVDSILDAILIDNVEIDDFCWFLIEDRTIKRILLKPKDIIDPETNNKVGSEIVVELKEKIDEDNLLVRGDINARKFCFITQKYFEDRDLTINTRVGFYYKTEDGTVRNHGNTIITPMEVSGSEGKLAYFCWSVPVGFSETLGSTTFSVCFYDATEINSYKMLTKPCKLTIHDSVSYLDEEELDEATWGEIINSQLEQLTSAIAEVQETYGVLAGFYQNGERKKSWEDIKQDETYKPLFNGTTIQSSSVPSIFSNLGTGTLVIGREIRTIGQNAFAGWNGLEEVKIQQGITSIKYNAFQGCTYLKTVRISNTVTEILSNAFDQCASLSTVYYEGSPEEWKKINIEFTGNTKLLSANIKYAKTTVGNGLQEEDGIISIDESVVLTKEDIEGLVVPGLYNENNQLIKSWAELKTTYPNAFSVAGKIIEDDEFKNNLKGKLILGKDIKIIGYRAFYECLTLTNIILPNELSIIEEEAFSNCYSLKDIILSNKLTSIGKYAFKNCGFSFIEIPNTVTEIKEGAFYGCYLLKTIKIPNFLYTIPKECFYYCQSLLSVDIPRMVTTIEKDAFDYCHNLQYVNYEGTEEQWEQIEMDVSDRNTLNQVVIFEADTYEKIYKNDLNGSNIPGVYSQEGILELTWNQLKEYSPKAFTKKGKIIGAVDPNTGEVKGGYLANFPNKKLIISNEITEIGEGAFYACNFSSIIIPNSVKIIKKYAFFGNTRLEELIIPNSVNYIDKYAFAHCDNLKKINLGNGLKFIDDYIFNHCSALEEINIGNGITRKTKLPSKWWEDFQQEYADAFVINSGIDIEICPNSSNISYFKDLEGNLVINEDTNVKTIQSNAFSNCKFNNIVLSNDISTIDSYAFSNSSLTKMILPKNLSIIADHTFYNCPILTHIFIPKSITKILSHAFGGNTDLISVYYEGSEEEWEQIEKSIGNDGLLTASIHYNRRSSSLTEDFIKPNINESGHYFKSVPLGYIDKGITVSSFTGPQNDGEDLFTLVLKDIYFKGNINTWKNITSEELSGLLYATNIHLLVDKKELDELFDNKLSREVVGELPTSNPKNNIIYMVLNEETEEENFYDEFMWIHEQWERIGSTRVDLTQYQKKLNPGQYLTINSYDNSISLNKTKLEKEWCFKVPGVYKQNQLQLTWDNLKSKYYQAFVSNSIRGKEIESTTNANEYYYESYFEETDIDDEFIISDYINKIDCATFKDCSLLQAVKIPDSVTYIGIEAFRGTSLKEITLPKNLTRIDERAFAFCRELESVIMPDLITHIGNEAFVLCNFKTIKIPKTIKSMGQWAPSSLTDVYFEGTKEEWEQALLTGGVTSIGVNAKIHYNQLINLNNGFNTEINLLINQKEDKLIHIDDISPIEHEVQVKLKINGKNLSPYSSIIAENGTKNFECNITQPITISAEHIPETQFDPEFNWAVEGRPSRINILYKNGEWENVYDTLEGEADYAPNILHTINATEENPIIFIEFSIVGLLTGGYQNVQIEYGEVATEFTPPIDISTIQIIKYGTDESDNLETIIPDDKDKIYKFTSLYPIMNFTTNNEFVELEVKYNQDINKIIYNLQQKIISLENQINGGITE